MYLNLSKRNNTAFSSGLLSRLKHLRVVRECRPISLSRMPLKPRSCLISLGHNRPSRDITRHHWAGIFSTAVFSHRGGLRIQSKNNAVHCVSVSTRAHIRNLIICSFGAISMTMPGGSNKILWQRLNSQYYAVGMDNIRRLLITLASVL